MLPWLLDHDKVDIFKAGQEAGLGFGFVATMEDILEMEQLTARNYFVELDHGAAGTFKYPGAPIRTTSSTSPQSPPSQGGKAAASQSSQVGQDNSAPLTKGRPQGGRPTGSAPDGNLILIPKAVADSAMDAAQCIGCGACVAACPNGAANLFTAAKIMHLNLLPQGQPERWERVTNMVQTMERYFGSCTNHGECQTACPKEISIDFIALMNRDYIKAQFKQRRLASQRG